VTLSQVYDNFNTPSLSIYNTSLVAPYLEDEGLRSYTGGVMWSDWMEVDPGISYTFSINDQNVIIPTFRTDCLLF
jgi:hypothetical protein